MPLHNAHLDGDPFLWEAGPTGLLLCHGYTATTTEVRPLARMLYRRGFTVAGPLLPGHGTSPAEMNRTRWEEWVEALDETYQQLRRRCRQVFIGGESMGGALAMYLASRHPQTAGVLLYSPAIKIPLRPLTLSYLARPFIPHKEKPNLNKLSPEWKGYRVNPIPAVHQLHSLQRQIWPRLAAMQQPLLVVQGRHDYSIDKRGVVDMYQRYPGPHKEFYWMENSGHMVLLDKERHQVAEITARFVLRVLAAEQTRLRRNGRNGRNGHYA